MVYSPVNAWTFPSNPNFPWLPQIRFITSISQATQAIITTSVPHGYSSGYTVRIVFPFPYALSFGMYQINGQTGVINVLSPTAFSIDIDASNFDPFVVGTTLESAQVVPIGQFTNADLNDSKQVNPVNPYLLVNVSLFQNPGLQAPGACNTSQT
jgi:hypothetical protein